MKTYYQILGVLDDAEDVVIRAAYKALAQKYHPDRWKGSQGEATAKMAEINAAYETLIDPIRRTSYDESIDRNCYSDDSDHEEEELILELDQKWVKVLEFLPNLSYFANKLSKLSKSLEYTFKLTLLETKKFNEGERIAENLESGFLTKYFGTNEQIQEFAKSLIYAGKRKEAKSLNDAVVLLGSEINPAVIINKIRGGSLTLNIDIKRKEQAKLLIDIKSVRCADDLMQTLGARVKSHGFWGNRVEIDFNGEIEVMSLNEYVEYASVFARRILEIG